MRRTRQVCVLCQFKPIVAIFPRVAVPSIARRPDNVHHLASGHEVNRFPTIHCAPYQLREEALKRTTEHGIVVGRIHAMAIQLDENPLGFSLHATGWLLPSPQPPKSWRIAAGQRAILQMNETITGCWTE